MSNPALPHGLVATVPALLTPRTKREEKSFARFAV
jgi:hypothetical protein